MDSESSGPEGSPKRKLYNAKTDTIIKLETLPDSRVKVIMLNSNETQHTYLIEYVLFRPVIFVLAVILPPVFKLCRILYLKFLNYDICKA